MKYYVFSTSQFDYFYIFFAGQIITGSKSSYVLTEKGDKYELAKCKEISKDDFEKISFYKRNYRNRFTITKDMFNALTSKYYEN